MGALHVDGEILGRGEDVAAVLTLDLCFIVVFVNLLSFIGVPLLPMVLVDVLRLLVSRVVHLVTVPAWNLSAAVLVGVIDERPIARELIATQQAFAVLSKNKQKLNMK